uniref:MPN domain-containing protein n=1 Tax=Oryza rufipogon TaxID=4529 RepID=A0A0E0QQQ2_ORYRU
MTLPGHGRGTLRGGGGVRPTSTSTKLFGVVLSSGGPPATGAPPRRRRWPAPKRSIHNDDVQAYGSALPPPAVKPDIVDGTSTSARPVDGDDVIEAPAPRPVAGVKKHIGLHVYYRFACSHLTQARVYREKENHVNLYAVLLRFLRLLLHTILKHPDYRTDNSSVKFFIEKTLLEVIGELEYLKPIVQQKRQQQQRNQQEKTTEDNIGTIGCKWYYVVTAKVPAKLNQDDLDGHSSTSQYSPTNSHDSRCSVSVEENEFSSSSEEEFPRVESIPKQISSMSFHSTQGHGISDCSPYRMVYVPEELISRFLNEAVENTTKSLETCGIIAGTLRVDMDVKYFIATDLIIPKQESTSYSREATNEEEILDIFEQLGSPSHLGWIHTHPTQECFMSSVDLHNHYSNQKDLREAFAIVVAPSKREQNIFHLTVPDGMDEIGDCDDRGFHPHDRTTYEECSHVKWDSTISLHNVVDLREC